MTTPFSLDLNEDQLQLKEWVHTFAKDVMRPAGPEWDEREEMPWPIIEEAAKIGIYSLDFIASAFGDPTGITFPMISEELAWGELSGVCADAISAAANVKPMAVLTSAPFIEQLPFAIPARHGSHDIAPLRRRTAGPDSHGREDRTGERLRLSRSCVREARV